MPLPPAIGLVLLLGSTPPSPAGPAADAKTPVSAKNGSTAASTRSASEKASPRSRSASDEARARRLALRVQRFYDALEDYRADFVQTYTRRALSRTTESSGVLTLQKGGKVHWSYQRPAEKLFVADGKTLWIYEPEERQVIVDRSYSTEKLGGSLAFLWGEGSLLESFEVRIPKDDPFGAGAATLELVPKQDKTYRRLLLRVDPNTGRVDESIVYETSGNTNRFRFTNAKVNAGVAERLFEFVPPAGVDVVVARPS